MAVSQLKVRGKQGVKGEERLQWDPESYNISLKETTIKSLYVHRSLQPQNIPQCTPTILAD